MNPEPLTSKARVGGPRMRPLVIDDAAREEVGRVRRHAEDACFVYRPRPGAAPPGDDPRHVCRLNTYRAVYSVTEFGGRRFRHLSVSVPGEQYPNVAACLTIADLFGFAGWDGQTTDRFPGGWMCRVSKEERCVVMAQEYEG